MRPTRLTRRAIWQRLLSVTMVLALGRGSSPAAANEAKGMTGSMDDIEQIRQLKARYFRLMDTKDWAGWRTVFADDVSVEVDIGVTTFGGTADSYRVEGADAFVASTSGKISEATTVHHGHMPEIELISATTAKGIWAMEDIVQWPGKPAYQGYGHYHETYRKGADGRWRIATLHLTRLRVGTQPA